MATRKIKTADELEAESRKLASKARAMRRAEAKVKAEAKAQVRLGLGTQIMDDVIGVEHDDEQALVSAIIEVLSSNDFASYLRSEVEKKLSTVEAEESDEAVDDDESTDMSQVDLSSHVSVDQHVVEDDEHVERADTRW